MSDDVKCPTCGGPMFDERTSKFWNGGKTRGGKAKPIYRCRDKDNCDGVIWEEKKAEQPAAEAPAPADVKPIAICTQWLAALDVVLEKALPKLTAKGIQPDAGAIFAATADLFNAKLQISPRGKQP